MKQIYLFLFIITFMPYIYAQNIYGPMTDYKGKPSASGKLLYEYFNHGSSSWLLECFIAENPGVIEWEIEKMLKKEVFKMDFFPYSYINLRWALFYLITKPKQDPQILELLAQYYYTNKYSIDRDMTAYILIKSSSQWKNKITADLENRSQNVKEIVEKYKYYEPKEKLNSREIRRRTFDKYMQMFSKGQLGKKKNQSYFYDWINNWSINEIINNMLRENAVSSKNVFLFTDFTDNMEEIPDELASEIIKYFKLDTSHPAKFPILERLMGKNPKLNSALLKTFRGFKEKNVSKTKLSADYILSYAQITGSYDKAFMAFMKRKKEFLQDYEINLEAMDLICWNSAFALLCGKSNLNIQNVSQILDKNAGIPNDWTLKPNPEFGKLVKTINFSSRLPDKMSMGFAFPINSLSPQVQEFALKEYLSIIMTPKRRTRNLQEIAFENIMSLESMQHRMTVIKTLIDSNCQKQLQALSLNYIPELLNIANGKDPIATVRACQVLSTTGALGAKAIPDLKQLLKTQDDFTIKIAAMCALAEIGDKSSVPLMKKYFDDKNRLLARAAKQAVYILQPIDKNDKFFNEMLKK